MADPKPVTIERLDLGLHTTARASQIPMGAAQDGSRNHWHHPPGVVKTPPGFTKLTTSLPNDYTYKLDGLTHYMRGSIASTGSLVKANTTGFTIEVIFRLDAIPQEYLAPGSGGYCSTLVYRGYGTAEQASHGFSSTAYGIFLLTNQSSGNKDPRVWFVYSDGVQIGSRVVNLTPIGLGSTYYVAAMVYEGSQNWNFYAGPVGGALTTNSDLAVSLVDGVQDLSGADLFIGATPITDTSSAMTPAFALYKDQCQYYMTGVIQELRFWSTNRTSTQIINASSSQIASPSSEANLTAYYQLTGSATNGYFITPTKGTAGSGNNQAPYLTIYPREATWRSSGHVLGNPTSGTYSLDFDGYAQGFEIESPWRYRKMQSDEDSEIPFSKYFAVAMRVKPRSLKDRTVLFHYTHVPDDAYSNHELTQTTSSGAFSTTDLSNLLIETLDTGAGAYRFRAVAFGTKPVEGETLTIDTVPVIDNVNTTLAETSCKPGSLVVTVTVGGANYVLTDDGLGSIAISTSGGAATLTTGTINYLTGAIVVTMSASITAATANYTGTKATSVVSTNNLAAGTQYSLTASIDRVTTAVQNEALTVTGNNVVDTLTARNAIPGTVIVTVEKTGGAGSVGLQDDSHGGFTIISGSSTINSASINYTTGAIGIDLVDNINPLGTNEVDYSHYSRNIQIQEGTSAKQSQTFPAGYEIPNTPELEFDIDYATTRKYVMSVAKGVDQCRHINNAPTVDEDVDIRWSFDKTFDGEIKQLIISNSEEEFDEETLHALCRDNIVTRTNSNRLGLPLASCWPMEEGDGNSIEDIGFVGNTINFDSDSKHVWGKSGITTTAKSKVVGIFDHRYRTPTGETRKVCAVAGGTIYEVNQSSGAMTALTDGFRNDDSNRVQTMRYQDSTILAAQGAHVGPLQLWKDQLYKLSIDPPEGPIPWGFTNQGNKEAGSRRGLRRYAFTFYSAHQNKRSGPGPFLDIQVRFKRADVVFGTDAEINQQYPSATSANKATYNTSAGGAKIGFSAWYGRTTVKNANDPDWYETQPGTSGANTNAAPLRRANLSGNPFINDNEAVTADEIEKVIDYQNNRVFVRVLADDKVQFRGAYPGSLGRLWLQDDMATIAGGVLRTNGIIDCGITSTGTVFTGTGQTGHNLPLPYSTDPQVTHLEIWRTVAGGNELFLIARIPNGTKSFTDSKRDAELVGETLNINQGAVPPTKYCIDFAGRAFFFGDELAPFRVYISDPAQPWNVPPQNTIDLLDGSTLKITGAARTENTLAMFKNDTTFVITATGNPDFPFNVETRHRDVGCVAPFGIVNVREIFHYPDEQGFFRFDTNTLQHISDNIDGTWATVPPAHYDKIVSVHDRTNSAIMWFYPSGDSSLSGSVINDSALVYFYEIGAWSKLDGIYVTYAAIVPDANEVNKVWLVDPAGYISVWGSGTNFGLGTLTSRGPFTTTNVVDTTNLEVDAATGTLATDQYTGLPVTIILANGDRYTRLVTASTTPSAGKTTITLDHAVTGMVTDSTQVVFGSIETDWISGQMAMAGISQMAQITSVHVQATPQTTSASFSLRFRSSGGINPTAIGWGSYSISNQRNEILVGLVDRTQAGSKSGRRLELGLRSFGPDQPFEVRYLTPFFSSDTAKSPGENRNDE